MKTETEPKRDEASEVAAFRLPTHLRKAARDKCQSEDLTFSQLMRRAIRRELTTEPQPSK